MLLNEHEAAEHLNMSVKFLRNRRAAKKEPRYSKLGNRVRYSVEALDQFIRDSEVEVAGGAEA